MHTYPQEFVFILPPGSLWPQERAHAQTILLFRVALLDKDYEMFFFHLEIGAPLHEVEAERRGRRQERVPAGEDQKSRGFRNRGRGSRHFYRAESAGGGRVSLLLRRPHPTGRDRQKVRSATRKYDLHESSAKWT